MKHLRGMIVPLVTPLTADYRVDVPALRSLCCTQIAAGINVLFVLGTTGEFYGLTSAQRREVIDVALESADGRVPVIAGVSGDSTAASLTALRDCGDNQLSGYVVSTPYFLRYSQAELTNHFRILSDSSPEQPLIIYNFPERYRHRIEISTVERLLRERRVLGIKDTSGDSSYFQDLLRLKQSFPEFLVFEGALPNLARSGTLGIDGSVQAIGNLLPHECASLWLSIVQGDWPTLEKETSHLWAFHQEIESVSIFIAALKACMAMRQWCSPMTSQPTAPLEGAQVERLRQAMQKSYPGLCRIDMEIACPEGISGWA